MPTDREVPALPKYCIVGAGPSGLAVAKNLLQRAIPFDCFEREADLGGNWNYGQPSSSVYDSVHLISSKRMTEYTDFPMPGAYPPFPSHRQVLEYLRSYAEHFGVAQRITFGTSVERITPSADGWDVTLSHGRPPRHYQGIIVANGHHWDPNRPEFPGRFDGEQIHSRQYKTPNILRGRRVLVIGAGNSGCDIAVEAAQHAADVTLSMRRGYHFLPKFLLGRPVDVCGERLHRWRLPLWLRRTIAGALASVALGRPHRYGLPAPDHRLFETHPIINSQLLYYVGHGAIRIKPDVAELCGSRVRFQDGSEEAVDLIILATGYKLSFPFLDQQHLNWRDGRPRLYLNAFHPDHDHLMFAGLIQPDSGQWGLTDYQAKLMGAFIVAMQHDPPRAAWFRQLKRQLHNDLSAGIRYIDSPRHYLEVEHFSYRRHLEHLLTRFGPTANLTRDGRPIATAYDAQSLPSE